MPLYEGCAVCRPTGVVAAAYDWRGLRDTSAAIGTVTWEWFAGHHREQAKNQFARALMNDPLPPYMLDMDHGRVGRDLVALAVYLPTGEPLLPVLGCFTAFPAVVQNLTPREREVAKLLSSLAVKEIAARLDVSPSTVETLKQRIGLRLGLRGPALMAELASLSDVL